MPLRFVYGLFPALVARRRQLASSLSAGERQMLAISIALVKRPRLLLLDEPSLGLAPVLVTRLMDTIAEINRPFRTAVLVAEQNMREALRIAQREEIVAPAQRLRGAPGPPLRDRHTLSRLTGSLRRAGRRRQSSAPVPRAGRG